MTPKIKAIKDGKTTRILKKLERLEDKVSLLKNKIVPECEIMVLTRCASYDI